MSNEPSPARWPRNPGLVYVLFPVAGYLGSLLGVAFIAVVVEKSPSAMLAIRSVGGWRWIIFGGLPAIFGGYVLLRAMRTYSKCLIVQWLAIVCALIASTSTTHAIAFLAGK